MEGVGSDTEMEGFLSGCLDHVLVGANPGRFQSLRAQLLIFVRDQVDAEGEFVDIGSLASEIEDSNLRVGNTTVKAGFGVGLDV